LGFLLFVLRFGGFFSVFIQLVSLSPFYSSVSKYPILKLIYVPPPAALPLLLPSKISIQNPDSQPAHTLNDGVRRRSQKPNLWGGGGYIVNMTKTFWVFEPKLFGFLPFWV
jgi:hypothetical protein